LILPANYLEYRLGDQESVSVEISCEYLKIQFTGLRHFERSFSAVEKSAFC